MWIMMQGTNKTLKHNKSKCVFAFVVDMKIWSFKLRKVYNGFEFLWHIHGGESLINVEQVKWMMISILAHFGDW